jgi:hypothetical protein
MGGDGRDDQSDAVRPAGPGNEPGLPGGEVEKPAERGAEPERRGDRHPVLRPTAPYPATTPPGGTGPGTGWQRFGFWWSRPVTVIAMAVVLLLLVSLLVVLLARDPGGTPVTQQTQTATVTTTSTVAAPVSRSPSPSATTGPTPSPSPADSPSPEPSGPGPGPQFPPVGDGQRHKTGAFVAIMGDFSDFDLDTNDVCSTCDIEVELTGLAAVNGAYLAKVDSKPGPFDCAKVPQPTWTEYLDIEEIRKGDIYCFITDESRYGALTIRTKDTTEGDDRVTVSFVVWTGPRD